MFSFLEWPLSLCLRLQYQVQLYKREIPLNFGNETDLTLMVIGIKV